MHNGTMATLEDVVDFYNAAAAMIAKKDRRLQPLDLSDDEKPIWWHFLNRCPARASTYRRLRLGEIDTDYPVIENWRNMQN